MEFNPLTVLGTLLGGLILAGILGWIRKPRLVAFVPKLFSHSKISDHGQIVEIWFLNRGFKNEEQIEATFNPQMRYELIGTNNPNISLEREKLLIPRIGAGDDSSVLLQVEGGKFTQADIVSCLSKETKGTITSKLEEVPVTSSQRVGLLAFVLVLGLLFIVVSKGIDWYFETKIADASSASNSEKKKNSQELMQGWQVAEHYEDNPIWKDVAQRKITISVDSIKRARQRAKVPVTVKNDSEAPLTVTLWISASADQDALSYDETRLANKLLMPGQSVNHTLNALIASNDKEPKVLVELFLESTDGESFKAKRLLSVE